MIMGSHLAYSSTPILHTTSGLEVVRFNRIG
jgi:hypothetical protein